MTHPQVKLKCPECTFGHLVERENSHNGSRFLGCTEYPRCTHTEPVPAYIEQIRAGATQLPGMDGL